MNIEEKQAIEMMKFYQEEYRKQIKTLKGNGEPEGYGTIIDTIKGRICNTQLVLNLIEKQQAELEKKDKVINEMAEMLSKRYCFALIPEKCNQGACDFDKSKCIPCIKEYFTNKEEREGK